MYEEIKKKKKKTAVMAEHGRIQNDEIKKNTARPRRRIGLVARFLP